jgi:adenylosuccinate synthase
MIILPDQIAKAQTIAVVCNQWGDTGKGKITDLLAAYWADVIVRGTGGNNAGHTIVINGKKRIFHLVPSGIIHEDKINILGNGMVIDLEVLCGELDELDKEKIKYDNLMISEDAHVILPYQVARDRRKNASQKKGGIGSTGRGIGPSYADKIARKGVMIRDLYNPDTLEGKIKERLKHYEILRKGEWFQEILEDKFEVTHDDITQRLGSLDIILEDDEIEELVKSGREELLDFYKEIATRKIDIKEETQRIMAELKPHADRIKPFVRDTISEIHKFMRQGKKILFEGAQGLLLSIEFGTYPYVTSSDCSVNGTATGVGLPAKAIDFAFGIVKSPYMTRVGAGPFPTELGGPESEKYCAAGLEHDIVFELTKYGIPFKEVNGDAKYDHHHPKIIELINSKDPFTQGVGIRLAGEEYGATTKRPRRTGWTDLVALKYAVGINGPDIVLTKVDVLQGANEFKLATGYDNSSYFTRDLDKLRACNPTYATYPGFSEDLSQIKDPNKLPLGLKQSIEDIKHFTGGRVWIISTGAERDHTLFMD